MYFNSFKPMPSLSTSSANDDILSRTIITHCGKGDNIMIQQCIQQSVELVACLLQSHRANSVTMGAIGARIPFLTLLIITLAKLSTGNDGRKNVLFIGKE